MDEHRTHQRIRSYLKGEIVHSGGTIRLECTVRDLSDEGARIRIGREINLPDPFELHIPQRGFIERAHIVWRHDDEVGVQFLHDASSAKAGSITSAPADRSVLARMETLENEITHLKQQMALMRAKLDRFTTERG